MFVRELHSRLPVPTPVAVSAANPGFCHSRLTRSVGNPFMRLGLAMMKTLIARTSEMGSRTLVHLPLNRMRCCGMADTYHAVSRRKRAITLSVRKGQRFLDAYG